jgi:hypothetical protein
MHERWRKAAKLGIKRNDTRGRGANAAEHPRANWMKDSDSSVEIQASDYAKSKKIYEYQSRWDLVTSTTHCGVTQRQVFAVGRKTGTLNAYGMQDSLL